MIKHAVLSFLITCFCFAVTAQVGINNSGAAPANSAMLDVKSTNKGALLPRVALTSLTDKTTIASPDTALVIYNTASAGSGDSRIVPGYYFWNGARWNSMGTDYDSVAYAGPSTALYMTQIPDYSLSPYIVYTTNAKAIPDNDLTGLKDSLSVRLPEHTVYDIVVRIRIDHTYDGDLDISLISPSGQETVLCSSVGGAGDNFGTGALGGYTYTSFGTLPAFSTPIASGAAPFAGNFQAMGNLSLLRGTDASGNWKLKIVDHNAADVGNLISWQLELYPAYDKKWYLLREVSMTYHSGTSIFARAYLSATAYSEYGQNLVIGLSTTSAGPVGTTYTGFVPYNTQVGVTQQRSNIFTDMNRIQEYNLNLSLFHKFDPVFFVDGQRYYFQLWRQGPGTSGVNALYVERKVN